MVLLCYFCYFIGSDLIMLGKMSILLEILTTVQNFDFIFFMQNIINFVFFFFGVYYHPDMRLAS